MRTQCSKKELEAGKMLACGLTNAQIARRLGVHTRVIDRRLVGFRTKGGIKAGNRQARR